VQYHPAQISVISNAVYNFQATGNFSPMAVITWNFGDGQTGTGTSVIHNYTVIGRYTVTVNVNDTADACTNSATDSVTITNINNCSVILQNTNYGTTNTLSTVVTSGTGPYQYQWSCNSDSTFSSTSPDPVVNVPYNTPTTYCVTVTDTTGCVASAAAAL
jgi:PKD repeat protein